jgi:hypothetical protein
MHKTAVAAFVAGYLLGFSATLAFALVLAWQGGEWWKEYRNDGF